MPTEIIKRLECTQTKTKKKHKNAEKANHPFTRTIRTAELVSGKHRGLNTHVRKDR